MNKILLITKREYLSRVMKKSFLVMTILGPILIAAFYAIIIFFAINDNIGNEFKKIAVVDNNGVLKKRIQNSDFISFTYINNEQAADTAIYDNYYALLQVPDTVNTKDLIIKIGSRENISLQTKGAIESKIKDAYESDNMEKLGIPAELLTSVKANISIQELKIEKDGKSTDSIYE